MKLALYQGPGRLNDVEGAFTLMAELAGRAKANGADLLLLPEMYLSGYNIGLTNAKNAAITTDGEGMGRAGKIAETNGIALAFGYPELVGDDVANSVVLIGPNGKVLLNYRKSHLFGDTDRGMFKSVGSEFGLAALGGFKIGFLVARHEIPARAYENQLYVAYANHAGSDDGFDYIGLSSICGPDGAVLAAAGRGEEIIYAVCDAGHQAAVRKSDPLIADRRPALYRPLAS
jgi:predicted amidohydrolase